MENGKWKRPLNTGFLPSSIYHFPSQDAFFSRPAEVTAGASCAKSSSAAASGGNVKSGAV
jgi:hypothetical protein